MQRASRRLLAVAVVAGALLALFAEAAPACAHITRDPEPFPWSRASDPAVRMREALAYAHGLPASAFLPFGAADALGDGSTAEESSSGRSAASASTAPNRCPAGEPQASAARHR